MATKYSVSIEKSGKGYIIPISEPLKKRLKIKSRKNSDVLSDGHVICISLDHKGDLKLLMQRWEKLLDGKLKPWSTHMLDPKRFAPPFRFIMFIIFKLIEDIYLNYYDLDHFMARFYNQKLLPLDKDDTPEITAVKEKLPKQFLNLYHAESVPQSIKTKKAIMDYLESEQFDELLRNDLNMSQVTHEYSNLKLESDDNPK